MFVGRSSLLALIDQVVKVPAEDGPGETRPVLVLEGCGGSGRTAVLEQALERWTDQTPAVLVRPLELDGDGDSAVRPVLAAVMLGLSLGAPGYTVAFPRVVLAHIALAEKTTGVDPGKALEGLRKRLNTYQDRTALIGFVADLVRAAGALAENIKVPGAAAIAPATADRIAQGVVARLQRSRWMVRFTWSEAALSWFGHQGQGRNFDPERALLRLSAQSRSEDPSVRRDVDDLLVAALLADLRHSLARTTGRPANVLVLLDDGDTPAAMSFTSSLLRVRQAIAATPGNPESELPDPLTMVTTSNGTLTGALARWLPPPAHWDETKPVAAADTSGLWLRMSLADLHSEHVLQLTRNQLWPDDLGTSAIASAVYRLTRGHAEATAFVLEKLNTEPRLVNDLDKVLRGLGPEPDVLVERHLLRPFVRGLNAHKLADETLLEALITLAAARNRLEAKALAPLLPPPVGVDSALFISPTLWSPAGASEQRRLHPLVRYLGLRALAARGAAAWTTVFECLRAAAGPDDLAGGLHHDRLLGKKEAVAAELARLLPEAHSDEWLDLFDEVIATADPRERDLDAIRGTGQPGTTTGHLVRLLGVLPALESSPLVTEWTALEKLRAHAAHGYRQLADHARDPAPFILRAQLYEGYERLGDRFL
ncbi:hypothetical protein [Amycolatopsis nigrescens]|uniref:hypothetical protein n=1 Tax=Amycolatopsis nigrescens TaxID=381445 RepID=UPI0003798F82|nr:hypothetical protein [Amycolatopsis nigrescens]